MKPVVRWKQTFESASGTFNESNAGLAGQEQDMSCSCPATLYLPTAKVY